MQRRATIRSHSLVKSRLMTSEDAHQRGSDNTIREGPSAKTSSYKRAYLLREKCEVLELKTVGIM